MLEKGNILGSLARAAGRAVRSPEVLTLLTLTQAACRGHLDDAPSYPASSCTYDLSSADNYDRAPFSDYVALTEVPREDGNEVVGYGYIENGTACTVKAYEAYEPRTGAPLGSTEVHLDLQHHDKGLAYPDGLELETAVGEELITDVRLSTECEDFGFETPADANICAAICPLGLWDNATRVLFTDSCESVISSNGDSTDLIPEIPDWVTED